MGSSGGAGTTITIPAHRAGDLIVIFAYRDGSNIAPSLPAGYINIASGAANFNSSRVGYKLAISASETSGTWTSATHLIVYVIRQFDNINAVNTTATRTGGTGTTVTYGTLSPLKDTDGRSLVIAFGGHRSVDTTLENAPTNMANRVTFVNATSEIAAHDGYLADWQSTNVSVAGTSSGWETIVIEVRGSKYVPNVIGGAARVVKNNPGILSANAGLG